MKSKRNKSSRFPLRIISACLLMALALVFIVIGVQRGEMSVVFNKAIRICMECVGLG